MGDVRAGIEGAGAALCEVDIDGTTFVSAPGDADLSDAAVDEALAEPLLLPPFDEYLLGYRNRDAVVTAEHLDAIVPGRNGMLKPIVVVDGEIVGLWSRATRTGTMTVQVEPFDVLPAPATDGLRRRVSEYGAFLDRAATLAVI